MVGRAAQPKHAGKHASTVHATSAHTQTSTRESAPRHVRAASVFGGIAAGCVLFAGTVGGISSLFPAQNQVDASLNYGYVYSGAKSSSTAFAKAGTPADAMLLFGSSELSTPAGLVPQVPAQIFGTNNYGLQLNCIGEAYDQSLWQAIAAGAYGATSAPRRMAIIVSPTWFENAGVDNDTFKLRFSYSLYRQFASNPQISDASKAYVKKRLLEQGVDEATVNAGARVNVIDSANDTLTSAVDDLKLRKELVDVRSQGIERPSGEAVSPDFEALQAQALVDARAVSTNNDWGMDDAFYTKNLAGRIDALRGAQSDETFSNENEYGDLSMFLNVCNEVGFEPLVIISPVHGEFYDLIGTNPDDRARCYERIRSICEAHGAEMADFSDKEYDQYFLHDIVHFGWTGWLAVDERLYDYARGN